MKVTLKNGMFVEGTPAEVADFIQNNKYEYDTEKYYLSSTHGLMLLRDMAVPHLKNALLKTYKAWIDDLRAIKDERKFLLAVVNGPSHLGGILKEINRRL